MIDGAAQRRALSAAEQAISALGSHARDRARAAARRAEDLDQVGAFAGLAGAVEAVLGGEPDGWDRVAAVAGDGPIGALIDQARPSS